MENVNRGAAEILEELRIRGDGFVGECDVKIKSTLIRLTFFAVLSLLTTALLIGNAWQHNLRMTMLLVLQPLFWAGMFYSALYRLMLLRAEKANVLKIQEKIYETNKVIEQALTGMAVEAAERTRMADSNGSTIWN